jgi:hypothetical protein
MLGQLLGLDNTATEQPNGASLGQSLAGRLAQPDTKAFLTNFGLSLMTPSYINNPWSGVAQAVGSGYEGMATVQRMQKVDEDKKLAKSEASAKDDKDFRQAKELKQMDVDSRDRLLGTRIAAKGVGSSTASDKLTATQARVYNDQLKALRKANSDLTTLGQEALSEDEIDAIAMRAAERAVGKGESGDKKDPTSATTAAEVAPLALPGATGTPKPTSPISNNAPTYERLFPDASGRAAAMSAKKVPDEFKADPRYSDQTEVGVRFRKILAERGYNVKSP